MFSKIWRKFPPTEGFLLFCFHRNIVSPGTYKKNIHTLPPLEAFSFFSNFLNFFFLTFSIFLLKKRIINFHSRSHLLKSNVICSQKTEFFKRSWHRQKNISCENFKNKKSLNKTFWWDKLSFATFFAKIGRKFSETFNFEYLHGSGCAKMFF